MTKTPQVSSKGRFKFKDGRVTIGSDDKAGYRVVMFQGKMHFLHRLIAKAFALPREEGQDTINHKDLNPSNNEVENLEWMSNAENISHSYANNLDRKSNAKAMSKLVEGRVVGSGENGWVLYDSGSKAARILNAANSSLNLSPGNISSCCREKRNKTCGYNFRFAEPTEVDLPGEVWKDVVLDEDEE